jgi:hypothetical protein
MFHPLLGDVSKIKDTELETKILDLGKKYHIALRLGQGSAAQQILLALGAYKEEQSKRQREALDATMTKKNKDLDNLINVD